MSTRPSWQELSSERPYNSLWAKLSALMTIISTQYADVFTCYSCALEWSEMVIVHNQSPTEALEKRRERWYLDRPITGAEPFSTFTTFNQRALRRTQETVKLSFRQYDG